MFDVWDLTGCQKQSWVVEKGLGGSCLDLGRVKNSSHIIWMGSDGFSRRHVKLTTKRPMKEWHWLFILQSPFLQETSHNYIIAFQALWSFVLLQILSDAHWTQLIGICILQSSWQTSKASGGSANGWEDLLLEGLEWAVVQLTCKQCLNSWSQNSTLKIRTKSIIS